VPVGRLVNGEWRLEIGERRFRRLSLLKNQGIGELVVAYDLVLLEYWSGSVYLTEKSDKMAFVAES